MSRLDYFTIAIIAICILAIAFLLYKTRSSDLFGGKKDSQTELQKTLKEMGIDTDAEDTTTFEADTTVEAVTDHATKPTESSDLPKATIAKPQTPSTSTTPATSPGKSSALTSKPSTPAPSTASSTKPTPAPSSGGEYLVVAGSFKLKHNAENEARRLQKLGYANASVEIFNKGTFATLVVDRFDTAKAADDLVAELKRKGVPAYKHRRRDDQ
jgi:cell division protein FtsN